MNNRGCYIKYKDPFGYFCWIENFSELKYKMVTWPEAAEIHSKLGDDHVAHNYRGQGGDVLHLSFKDKDGNSCNYFLADEVYLLNSTGGTIEVLKKRS